MRKHIKWFIFLVIFTSISAKAEASEWKLIEDEGNVRFIGALEGAAFRGRFDVFSAMINFDPANPGDGKIIGEVKMNSADSGDAEYDAYLMEPDWFNPEDFPNSRFESELIETLDNGTYAAHGDLTIVGVSQPITMIFEFESSNGIANFSGTFEVKRLLFGIGWDATNWIADEVGIQIDLKLKQ
jgi:polyisoprenoid-binding protein YceI